jgi:hypothetical protein
MLKKKLSKIVIVIVQCKYLMSEQNRTERNNMAEEVRRDRWRAKEKRMTEKRRKQTT